MMADINIGETHRQCLTWFTRKASPRCCAPASPIPLPQRCSEVSVCDDGGHNTSGKLHRQCLTWFTRKASPRCCAPAAPILLRQRSSVVSVCDDGGHRTLGKLHRQCLTWFTRKASPRCFAPASPILLSRRFSVVSVCDMADIEHWGNVIVSVSLGSPARPRLDAALLQHRYCCAKDPVW